MNEHTYTPMAIWGRELRHYRKLAGLTQLELAAEINYSHSLVSQAETGQVPASEEFAAACEKRLNSGGALVRLLDYRKGDIPPWQVEWMPYEEGAGVIRTFQTRLIYGLLQTEAYARVVLDGDEPAIARRLDRQAILHRTEPPMLYVVLDEAVLYRPVGGPEAMREQLMHLVEISSSRVQIQILPNGGHLATQGPFVLATLENGTTAAYLETGIRGLVATSLADIARGNAAWEAIRADALPVGMSKDLIKRTAEERWAR